MHSCITVLKTPISGREDIHFEAQQTFSLIRHQFNIRQKVSLEKKILNSKNLGYVANRKCF